MSNSKELKAPAVVQFGFKNLRVSSSSNNNEKEDKWHAACRYCSLKDVELCRHLRSKLHVVVVRYWYLGYMHIFD